MSRAWALALNSQFQVRLSYIFSNIMYSKYSVRKVCHPVRKECRPESKKCNPESKNVILSAVEGSYTAYGFEILTVRSFGCAQDDNIRSFNAQDDNPWRIMTILLLDFKIYSLFTIHYSLFTIHYSLFTIHYPLLAIAY